MKSFVVFLAVIAVASAAAVDKRPSGLPALRAEHGGEVVSRGGIGTRIVGGNPGDINNIPYILALQELWFGNVYLDLCGAVIISATRGLTAAQCTEKWPNHPLAVRAGSIDTRTGGQFVEVTNPVVHPSYNRNTLDNDISVLILATALNLALPGIAAIGIPAQGADTAVGTMARVSGWGSLYEGHPGVYLLEYVEVPVITNALCNQQHGGGITAAMLCAGFPEGGRNVCKGDSGGPLTAGNELIGIVSSGYGCSRTHLAGVYARVSHFTNWINSYLQ